MCSQVARGPGKGSTHPLELITNIPCSCGWGSASLFFAERFPNSQITAFSNSRTQKEYINTVANSKGLHNLNVITGDAADYEFEPEAFDRVVSIEMFEHMKNYHLLLEKVSRALKPGGKLFLHIFCHKDTPYDFEGGWMSEFFFTGGESSLCLRPLKVPLSIQPSFFFVSNSSNHFTSDPKSSLSFWKKIILLLPIICMTLTLYRNHALCRSPAILPVQSLSTASMVGKRTALCPDMRGLAHDHAPQQKFHMARPCRNVRRKGRCNMVEPLADLLYGLRRAVQVGGW